MKHHYVERRGQDSHGSWSVGKGAISAGVLIQLTAGFSQTRVGIPADHALRLASELTTAAIAAMAGLSCHFGDRDTVWEIEAGLETAHGVNDEVLLRLYDAAGKNGDHRTDVALPIPDVLNMVEELSRRALQISRALRADSLSRFGRSAA